MQQGPVSRCCFQAGSSGELELCKRSINYIPTSHMRMREKRVTQSHPFGSHMSVSFKNILFTKSSFSLAVILTALPYMYRVAGDSKLSRTTMSATLAVGSLFSRQSSGGWWDKETSNSVQPFFETTVGNNHLHAVLRPEVSQFTTVMNRSCNQK